MNDISKCHTQRQTDRSNFYYSKAFSFIYHNILKNKSTDICLTVKAIAWYKPQFILQTYVCAPCFLPAPCALLQMTPALLFRFFINSSPQTQGQKYCTVFLHNSISWVLCFFYPDRLIFLIIIIIGGFLNICHTTGLPPKEGELVFKLLCFTFYVCFWIFSGSDLILALYLHKWESHSQLRSQGTTAMQLLSSPSLSAQSTRMCF